MLSRSGTVALLGLGTVWLMWIIPLTTVSLEHKDTVARAYAWRAPEETDAWHVPKEADAQHATRVAVGKGFGVVYLVAGRDDLSNGTSKIRGYFAEAMQSMLSLREGLPLVPVEIFVLREHAEEAERLVSLVDEEGYRLGMVRVMILDTTAWQSNMTTDTLFHLKAYALEQSTFGVPLFMDTDTYVCKAALEGLISEVLRSKCDIAAVRTSQRFPAFSGKSGLLARALKLNKSDAAEWPEFMEVNSGALLANKRAGEVRDVLIEWQRKSDWWIEDASRHYKSAQRWNDQGPLRVALFLHRKSLNLCLGPIEHVQVQCTGNGLWKKKGKLFDANQSSCDKYCPEQSAILHGHAVRRAHRTHALPP